MNSYGNYDIENLNPIKSSFESKKLYSLWQLFKWNGEEIKKDIDLVRTLTYEISDTNTIIGSQPIIVGENSRIEACILNVEDGPIYIGKNAHIMEGSILKGPLAICDDSTIKMGAKLYSNSTIGPNCKVGGEVNNSIFYAYSNKGHDGFLGNSIIGEWCNIGADSNNSNLKNNYANVKLWNYGKESFIDTGEQFCGLMMGDHSKCGINTMFNTGTVAGVSCNIFGSGFPRNFIPSFSWGGSNGFKTYNFNKALESAQLMMERRGKSLSEADIEILKDSFENDQKFRND